MNILKKLFFSKQLNNEFKSINKFQSSIMEKFRLIQAGVVSHKLDLSTIKTGDKVWVEATVSRNENKKGGFKVVFEEIDRENADKIIKRHFPRIEI